MGKMFKKSSDKIGNTIHLLILFMFVSKVTNAIANSDNEVSDDNASNITSTSNSYSLANTDELHNPMLLKHQAENEQVHSLEDMSLNAYNKSALEFNENSNVTDDQDVSHNNISNTNNQNKSELPSTYDSNEENVDITTTTSQLIHTTMVSDYVRHGKSKLFYETDTVNDSSVSNSDSLEDMGYSFSLERNKLQNESSMSLLEQDNQNDNLIYKTNPIALKFVSRSSNDVMKSNSNEAPGNTLDETKQSVQNISGEEYYDEYFSHENSDEKISKTELEKETIDIALQNQPNQSPAHSNFKLPIMNMRNTNGTFTQNLADMKFETPKKDFFEYLTTEAPVSAISTLENKEITKTKNRLPNKQGKQINISHRKLSPHEQLHYFVEDAYIRTPLAVIVDPSSEVLAKTKALWTAALRTNLNIKIILVCLNASDSPAAYNFNNTSQFLAGLNSIKENIGGDSLIGVVHAAELVPYDSAIFMSTAITAPHTELVQDAAITLLKKRIRLYLIWYGNRPMIENETQDAVGGILGEIAIRSGGEILHIVENDDSEEIEGTPSTFVAQDLRGAQEIDIPLDAKALNLHIKIDAPMKEAKLEAPTGDINLKKYVKLKSPMLNHVDGERNLDAYVPLREMHNCKVLKLKLTPETFENEYTVVIRTERKPDLFLDNVVKRFEEYFRRGISSIPIKYRKSQLASNIDIPGSLFRKETHSDFTFPDDSLKQYSAIDINEPKKEVEIFSDIEVIKDSSLNRTKMHSNTNFLKMYTSSILKQCGTQIEMSTQSKLIVAPGMTGNLFFELTNTRSHSVQHNIFVVDERSYLLALKPQRIALRSEETVTVNLIVTVPIDAPKGTTDRITFTIQDDGTGDINTLIVNLKVDNSAEALDTTLPILSWRFGSRCDKIASESTDCINRFWSLDIIAQDWGSGILRVLSSTHTGLIYPTSYSVGSTEPLRVTYISSCCNPRTTLTAVDVMGNQRSYNIDVRDFELTDATIVAIVLGSLLLLLLLTIVIVGIIWCCRRHKTSFDMPTYRSHSTRSME